MKKLLVLISLVLLLPTLGQSVEYRWENEAGKEMNMSTLQGEPVVLHFWASWCPPCRSEMPALVKWVEANPKIKVVMVSLDNDRDNAAEFYVEQGIKTALNMGNMSDASRIGVRGLPSTFVIGADGEIKKRHIGDIEWGNSVAINELLH